MNLFSWLLIGHLVGDYIFQISWMAENKSSRLLPLLVHSAVYTVIVALFALLAAKGLSWPGIALVFVAHLILDQRKFVDFWAKYITGTAQIQWLKIALDQSWHILILGLATLL